MPPAKYVCIAKNPVLAFCSSFVLEKLISSVSWDGSIALWKKEAINQGEKTVSSI